MPPANDLKERREAIQRADLEFYRVKREKLYRERAKYGCSSDGELPRDAVNRASAAASRAKLVYLARDLENRTDQLEYVRNLLDERSKRLAKKVKDLQDDRKNVRNVLQTLWERKDPTICAILLESNIIHILRAVEDDTCYVTDSTSMSPIRCPIPQINAGGARRAPAVDISGLQPSSPLGSTTTEMVKLPGIRFPNMQPRRRSLGNTLPRARNLTSDEKLGPFLIQRESEVHSREKLASTQFKSRKKRTRRSQKQIRASLRVEYTESGVQLPKQWYDAVRDVVRSESNATATYA